MMTGSMPNLKGLETLLLLLDDNRHIDVGITFLESNDVLVAQADTTLAGTAWDTFLIVCAAVDAYS